MVTLKDQSMVKLGSTRIESLNAVAGAFDMVTVFPAIVPGAERQKPSLPVPMTVIVTPFTGFASVNVAETVAQV